MKGDTLVAVGASLGGLSALKTLLAALPPSLRCAVVLVQHRKADADSHLADILGDYSALAVSEPDDKEPIEPGRVYLAPPNYHLIVERGFFSLSTDVPVCFARPSIDVLFESVADSYGTGAIAVMLTGANEDGAAGARAVKTAGGRVLVQDPRTAESPVAPQAVLAATPVDAILGIKEIAAFLEQGLRGLIDSSDACTIWVQARAFRHTGETWLPDRDRDRPCFRSQRRELPWHVCRFLSLTRNSNERDELLRAWFADRWHTVRGPVGRKGRRWLIAAGVLLAVLVFIRLGLDPLASHFTRKALNSGDAIEGDFLRVHVTIVPPGYEIRRLKIVERASEDWRRPLFYAERTRVSLSWRDLFHARLAASLRLDDPKIVVTNRKPPPKDKTKTKTPDIAAALGQLVPVRVNRIEVRNGEVLYRDLTAPREPQIWVHEIEAAAENLATRPALALGRPATVSASATLGDSGALGLFVSADPFHGRPDFAGTATLRGWRVAELYALEQPATQLQTPKGTLSLFAKFKARDGAISGGVKPVLENVAIRPTEESFGNHLKAWAANAGSHLFSDRVPGRNAVATIVPIEGRLDDPDIQLWPTVLGVVRNASLAPGLAASATDRGAGRLRPRYRDARCPQRTVPTQTFFAVPLAGQSA